MKQQYFQDFKHVLVMGLLGSVVLMSVSQAQNAPVLPVSPVLLVPPEAPEAPEAPVPLVPPVLSAFLVAEQETAEEKAQKRDTALLMSVLVESKLTMDQRREAALSLLHKGWQKAIALMVKEFSQPTDSSNQQVIAQAVATYEGVPPHAFVGPLLSSLKDSNEALLGDVAAALGRYQDEIQVTSQLVSLAVDKELDGAIRHGAIVALGYHRNRDVVGVLINLLSVQQPVKVRSASAASLSRLTGIHHYGQNLQAWSIWWESHRDLDEKRWLLDLIGNFAEHAASLSDANQRITKRLVESQRQLYLATSLDERTQMLEKMLAAPDLSMRLLAMDLIVQRLVDQQSIGETLRASVIVALGDPSAEIRASSAQLVRDLSDAKGADAIAQRMDAETDPAVLRTYLLAMASMPREQALGKAMRLLGDVALQNAAAGVLERAIADGLVNKQNKQALTRHLRQLTAGDDTLSPKMIELLGRVATEDDWLRIAGWMDSTNDAVGIAAAEAWASSDRPLDELAKRSESQRFLPILLRAAVKRGTKGQTLIQIARYKPKAVQLVESWQQALQAMAPRVSAADVIEADRVLAEHQDVAVVRERMLSAAIGESNGSVDVELLLSRAAVRLETQQAIQALADLGLVESRSQVLTPESLDRLRWLMVRAAFEASQPEKAWQTVTQWFAALESETARQTLAGQLLVYQGVRINKAIEAHQVDLATLQLSQLTQQTQAYLSPSSKSKLDVLKGRVTDLSKVIESEQAASAAEVKTQAATANTAATTSPAPVVTP